MVGPDVKTEVFKYRKKVPKDSQLYHHYPGAKIIFQKRNNSISLQFKLLRNFVHTQKKTVHEIRLPFFSLHF